MEKLCMSARLWVSGIIRSRFGRTNGVYPRDVAEHGSGHPADLRWSLLEQTAIKLKQTESTGPMITNIYGKQLSDLEKMRVEEKIRHVKEAIPDEVYEVLTTEWRRFVTRSSRAREK